MGEGELCELASLKLDSPEAEKKKKWAGRVEKSEKEFALSMLKAKRKLFL